MLTKIGLIDVVDESDNSRDYAFIKNNKGVISSLRWKSNSDDIRENKVVINGSQLDLVLEHQEAFNSIRSGQWKYKGSEYLKEVKMVNDVMKECNIPNINVRYGINYQKVK